MPIKVSIKTVDGNRFDYIRFVEDRIFDEDSNDIWGIVRTDGMTRMFFMKNIVMVTIRTEEDVEA